MADTHSHNAQVHRHEHTHITQDLRHGQQRAHMDVEPRHEHHHAAVSLPAGAGPLVLRIGLAIGGLRGCLGTSFAVCGRSWALVLAPWAVAGAQKRPNRTMAGTWGRSLMIVLFVPHAAG